MVYNEINTPLRYSSGFDTVLIFGSLSLAAADCNRATPLAVVLVMVVGGGGSKRQNGMLVRLP